MTYTAEDALKYVTRSSSEEDKFLRWLRRDKVKHQRLARTYSLKEVASFLNIPLETLKQKVTSMHFSRLTKNSGYRLTSDQIAEVRKQL